MLRAFHPLLPWLVASLLFGLLIAEVQRELSGDAVQRVHDTTFGTLERLPVRRDAGKALLLIGNSRLGFAIPTQRLLSQVAEPAGLGDATSRLVYGAELSASELRKQSWRLVAFRPTVVVMQIDLMLTLPPKTRRFEVIRRYEGYARSGADLDAGLAILSQLWESRRVVLEAPIGRSVDRQLSSAWQADRAALHEMLRARGLEVIATDWPCPDQDFDDGVHYSAEGASRFRSWLGTSLAKP